MIYIVNDDESRILADDGESYVTDLRGAKAFDSWGDASDALQNMSDDWKIIEF